MGDRQLQRPLTQQQAERPINIRQTSFAGGLFFDLPGSEIPNNALHLLENAIAFPTHIEGRTGSIEYNLGNQANWPRDRTGLMGSKSGDIITCGDANFTEDDVKWYWIHDDGIHDEIIQYISATQVRVRDSISHGVSHNGGIRGPLNGHYYHKTQNLVVRLFGDGVYVADNDLTSYTRVINKSIDNPNSAVSDFDEQNQYVIMQNSGGQFKIKLDGEYYLMWKTNTPVPAVRITSTVDESSIPTTTPYVYRYVYSMGRLLGMGHNRNRTTRGVTREQESGTCIADWQTYNDFGSVAAANPISATNGLTIGELHIPANPTTPTLREWHWNYYSVYRTLEIGTEYTDPEFGLNSKAIMIWVEDILVCKAYTASATRGVITASQGQFAIHDIGSVIEFQDGTRLEITGYIDEQNVNYATEYYYNETIPEQSATIGNSDVLTCSQLNDTVTLISGQRNFTAADVGKPIFWCDGTWANITAFNNATSVTVAEARTRPPQGAGIDPTYRHFHDTIPDEIDLNQVNNLRARLNAGDVGALLYYTQTRFFRRTPEANMLCVAPGFVFSGVRGSYVVEYVPILEGGEYLTGYYYPGVHISDNIKDGVSDLKLFQDRIIAFCRNTTWGGSTNELNQQIIENVGVTLSRFAGFSLLDADIGVADYGGIEYTESGRMRIPTNEKGTIGSREFDGYKYGPDNTVSPDGRNNMVKKLMNEMYNNFASGYIDGEYFIWGIEGL